MSNVITFPRKRGRPRKIREEKDLGTPELQAKRNALETVEALDLCLEKGIITQEQHWCGIHLRWLHTLRYGAPGVRAMDLSEISGIDIISDDPAWREAREAEYHVAVTTLSGKADIKLLIDICVHNERPEFFRAEGRKIYRSVKELQRLREGLDVLVAHWRKHTKPIKRS